jgi:hypothetical protein
MGIGTVVCQTSTTFTFDGGGGGVSFLPQDEKINGNANAITMIPFRIGVKLIFISIKYPMKLIKSGKQFAILTNISINLIFAL